MEAKDKKLIVFHLPKWYPNRYDGLLGVFVKRHILSTMSSSIPVVLYAMSSQNSDQWYEIEEEMEEGILTYRCYYKKNIFGIGALDRLLKLFLYCWLIVNIYRRAKKKTGKPDLIHAHILLRTAVLARFIEWIDRVPYLLLEHSSVFIRKEVQAYPHFFSRWLVRYTVKKAKAVITVSECLGQAMRERYGLLNANYHVVYNCVNTTVFSEKPVSVAKPVKELLYVAEFDDGPKNISGLLRVLASLYAKRQDFKVNFVGYGKDEATLIALADELNIRNKAVFFQGKYSSAGVAAALQQSDALLMFSRFETLSCIITEALCCGTPVVSTAVGGIVEIVNTSNGLLVPQADETAMQASIEQLLDEQVIFHSHEIAQQAHVLFSNEAVGQRLLRLYKQHAAC